VTEQLSVSAALLLGLLGSSHCLVMCGGISGALGMGSSPEGQWSKLALFQLGRIASYGLLGAGLGGLLALGTQASPGLMVVLRGLAGLLLIAMGLYVSSWWQGLLWLEKAGGLLWRRVQPLTGHWLPVRRNHHALLLGASWGLLPCGLIYTALAWSATAADPLWSGLLMLCFGIGTLPAMFAAGVTGARLAGLLKRRSLRNSAALALIAFGCWTLFAAGGHLPGDHAAHAVALHN
jgi:sulfite exporter TauE/SafE